MKLALTSQFTGKVNKMDLPITAEEYMRWRHSGELVQNAFPQLDADQREFLLTGATPEEWEAVFGTEEE